MRRSPGIIVFALALALPLLSPAQMSPQVSEHEALTKAAQISDPAERIKALERFLKDHPGTTMAPQAYSRLLDAYASTAVNKPENAAKVVETAEKFIQAAPDSSKAGAYNNTASTLAQNGVALEKAMEYARKALELAESQKASQRTKSTYLDTLASVELARGEYASAEKHAREAIAGLPQSADAFASNATYYARLGKILIKSGAGVPEGAGLVAKAVLLAQFADSEGLLDEALKAQGAADLEKARVDLMRKAGREYIDAASGTERAAAMSAVAAGYTRKGILPDEAIELARKAVAMETALTPAQAVLDGRRTLGTIYTKQKNHKEAVAQFEPVARIAPSFDLEFHLNYAQNLEALGRNEDAIKAYMKGLAPLPSAAQAGSRLWKPLNELYAKVNGSDRGLKEKLARVGEEAAAFAPPAAPRKPPSNRVVLAELFTGSECAPCVAADAAFDHMIENYDRSALAVLVYHLHIPGPDPMTNTDTETRMKYYAVRGTPTAAIGGSSVSAGGGSKAAARSRYDFYTYDVDRRLTLGSPVKIELSGEVRQSSLSVKASASASGVSGDLKLRIALAEEVVHYKGSNGVEEHRAVVRQMIGTPEGIPLTGGKAEYSATVDLAALSAGLKAYLDEYEKNSTRKDFKWKEKKHEINAANLSLVAFVQDDTTKEVLQAAYKTMGDGPR